MMMMNEYEDGLLNDCGERKYNMNYQILGTTGLDLIIQRYHYHNYVQQRFYERCNDGSEEREQMMMTRRRKKRKKKEEEE